MSLALADYLLKAYSDSDPDIQRLLNNIDLHILHSVNPDGFEVAAQKCHGIEGRLNANGVRFFRFFSISRRYQALKTVSNFEQIFKLPS